MRAFSILLFTALLAQAPVAAGDKVKNPPKTELIADEPWVAGHTLAQWTEFFAKGDAKQKARAVEMIAWCCTQRKSQEAAKVMVDVLNEPEHRLAACKAFAHMGLEGRVAAAALVPCASEKEKSPDTRLAAIDALGSIGVGTPEVIAVLMKGIHASSDEMRRTAGHAIYRIGPDATPLVPELAKALDDKAPVVAESAAIALSGIGPDAKAAAPALIEALRYPNFLVRRHAAEALRRLHSGDRAVHKALIAAMKDENDEVAAGAVWAFYFCQNTGDEVIDGQVWALENGNEGARYHAANALSEIGIESPKTVAPLVRALKDPKTRRLAASAVGKRRPATEGTIAALLAAFEQDHYDRIAIATALGEMGVAAESAGRRLKAALGERKAEPTWSYELVQVAVANAVWKITKDREMIPVLVKLARYPHDQHVTGAALNALGEIGADAKDAVKELTAALENPREALWAARALVKIGAPTGEETLRKLMASKDKNRLLAAHVLWELKSDSDALRVLADAARKDKDHSQRRHAVMAVAKAAVDNELAVLCLVSALEDECSYVQREAAKALMRFGREGRPAVRTLARMVTGPSWAAADQAVRTLAALGPEAAAALPQLRKAAENPALREAATEAIAQIEGIR